MAVKSSNVAAVSWWLAQISRKREEGEERRGYKKKRERWGEERRWRRRSRGLHLQRSRRHQPVAEMGILSLFYLSLVFIFLSASASLHTSPSRAVLFSRGARPVHSVFSGGRPLPFIPRPARSFHPALLFFFHPSRVVLVTFRFTVGVAVGSPSRSLLFQCCPCI